MLPRVSWKVLCLWVALLATLAMFPLARAFPTFPGDERALLALQGLQSDWLDEAALAASTVGRVPVAVSLVLGLSLILLLLRRRLDALMVVLSLVPIAAGNGLKVVIARPRPEYLLAGSAPDSLSFPSGHALYAALLGGILIFLFGEMVRSPATRRCLQIGAALAVLAMGVSRVYLGVHWPSDVLGGYLFGGVALLGLVALRNKLAGSTQAAALVQRHVKQ